MVSFSGHICRGLQGYTRLFSLPKFSTGVKSGGEAFACCSYTPALTVDFVTIINFRISIVGWPRAEKIISKPTEGNPLLNVTFNTQGKVVCSQVSWFFSPQIFFTSLFPNSKMSWEERNLMLCTNSMTTERRKDNVSKVLTIIQLLLHLVS